MFFFPCSEVVRSQKKVSLSNIELHIGMHVQIRKFTSGDFLSYTQRTVMYTCSFIKGF